MNFIDLLQQYRIDAVIVAVVTTILTGVVKIPLKILAKNTGIGDKLTRFITFLPVAIAFGVAVCTEYFFSESIAFSTDLYTCWIAGASGSLAIYAFWEKFVPSKDKILSRAEIDANEELVDKVKSLLNTTMITDVAENDGANLQEKTENVSSCNAKKIIITNRK